MRARVSGCRCPPKKQNAAALQPPKTRSQRTTGPCSGVMVTNASLPALARASKMAIHHRLWPSYVALYDLPRTSGTWGPSAKPVRAWTWRTAGEMAAMTFSSSGSPADQHIQRTPAEQPVVVRWQPHAVFCCCCCCSSSPLTGLRLRHDAEVTVVRAQLQGRVPRQDVNHDPRPARDATPKARRGQ